MIKFMDINNKSFVMRTIICFIFFTVFIICVYGFNKKHNIENSTGQEYTQKAKVLEIINEDVEFVRGVYAGTQDVKIEILTGGLKGNILETKNYLSYMYSVYCRPGMSVIVDVSESGGNIIADIMSYDREWAIYLIVLFFCVITCIISGIKGFKSLLALAFTLICVFFIFVPMLYWGYSPYASAIFISIITICITMFLITGLSKKTLSAIIGTCVGIITSGVFYQIFSIIVKVNGYNAGDIEDMMVISQYQGMDAGGLLFAGILIASLGAVMDVAMSISSAIYEIYITDNTLSAKKLFKSGINIGRDMMGTMINTLILAFTGGALNLLIRIYSAQTPYIAVINFNSIALEIIYGLAGSIGIILTVPFVSLVSAFLYTKKIKLNKKLKS